MDYLVASDYILETISWKTFHAKDICLNSRYVEWNKTFFRDCMLLLTKHLNLVLDDNAIYSTSVSGKIKLTVLENHDKF